MEFPDLSNYVSPLSWRYGSNEMRRIFSEENKYRLWRKIWVNLAKIQYEAGLVSKEELVDLVANENDLDIPRILEIEMETRHDVMAAIKEFAEKAKVGGGKIHLGATSMDVVDNADMIRTKEALILVEQNLKKLLAIFLEQIEKYARLPCIGFTHIQPAEPTTVGYRLAFYAQDLLTDISLLQSIKVLVKAKGFKGAVGTRASYTALLKGNKLTADMLDKMVMKSLGLESDLVTTQVYSRKYDYLVLTLLASIASSCAKFAGDLRILQSPPLGEWSEPFGKKQVGSSAMPFKKNPVNSEKICSLARFVGALPPVALENATLSYLERTLDDSANKRIIMAESFIAVDEILLITQKVISGLVVNKERVAFNLNQYGPFAATEVILVEAVKNGGDRQKLHELLRELSLEAWSDIGQGEKNPLPQMLMENHELHKYLTKSQIEGLLDVSNHIGDAPQRALELVGKIKKMLRACLETGFLSFRPQRTK
ncbi:MAG: Adenylosuccinate lyase [Candidatus Gottesmanbacteria bacterium GW2011_GWC1_43_10]|nr:MAG: Adenylosuccinate lyase [Candidatus Gottesmanbacteria bacterium GW2011_GWC1_43_10]